MEKNPLSPHIQIYKWHISSLVSITTRITGIINTIVISLLCLWISSLLLGEETYKSVNYFLSSFIGKFFVIGIIWSFSFQMLSEIRHIIMDLGYGFDLKTTKIDLFGFFMTLDHCEKPLELLEKILKRKY